MSSLKVVAQAPRELQDKHVDPLKYIHSCLPPSAGLENPKTHSQSDHVRDTGDLEENMSDLRSNTVRATAVGVAKMPGYLSGVTIVKTDLQLIPENPFMQTCVCL